MKTAQNNMALVSFNYTDYAMPIPDACALIQIFQKAARYEEHYKREEGAESGKTFRYLGGDIPNISMRVLDAGKYQEALNNGERPKDE